MPFRDFFFEQGRLLEVNGKLIPTWKLKALTNRVCVVMLRVLGVQFKLRIGCVRVGVMRWFLSFVRALNGDCVTGLRKV